MRRFAGLYLIICLAGGCAPKEWKPLGSSALRDSPARTIGVVGSRLPSFYVRTPAGVSSGLGGLVVMAAEGNQLVKEKRVVDPSLAIGARLGTALAVKDRLVAKTPKPVAGSNDRWDTDL